MGIERLRCSVTDSGFFYKNWKRGGIKKLSRKVHETGLHDLVTGSGRPRTSRSCVVQRGAVADLTNGQHTCELVFKSTADILNVRRDYQFVFSVLDELYVSHHT